MSGKIDLIGPAAQGGRDRDRRRDGLHLLPGDGTRRPVTRWSRRIGVEMANRLIHEGREGTRLAQWRRSSRERLEAGGETRDRGSGTEIPPDGRCTTSMRPPEGFRRRHREAGTMVWNGPIGVFEKPPFDHGTPAMAHALADATSKGRSRSSVAATRQRRWPPAGLSDKMTHVSTGGGAVWSSWKGRRCRGWRLWTMSEQREQ